MDSSQISIMEKEWALQKVQAEILKNEIALLKVRKGISIQESNPLREDTAIQKGSSNSQSIIKKEWFVVKTGPKQGIYDTFEKLKEVIKDLPYSFTKYTSEEEAKQAYTSYLGPRVPTTFPQSSYKMALEETSKKNWSEDEKQMFSLGKIPQQQPIIRKDPFGFTKEDWIESVNELRRSAMEN